MIGYNQIAGRNEANVKIMYDYIFMLNYHNLIYKNKTELLATIDLGILMEH